MTSSSSLLVEPIIDVVVVGSGAAGIELAMALWGRWKPFVVKDDNSSSEESDNARANNNFRITLLDAGDELFPQETRKNRKALLEVLAERQIDVRHGVQVERVLPKQLVLDSGEKLSFTHCLWATGATSHPLASSLAKRGLPIDPDRGWIRVNDYLQIVDTTNFPNVFAAGDCCTIERSGTDENGNALPTPPKAGVYAVRAGPILIENLISCLYNQPLKPYVPQDDFLKLLVCGDGKALGFRFGIPLYGRWVFQLKDAIDRSFMDSFVEQNLPELVQGQAYDVSQYDATGDRPEPIEPVDAATLLQRTDDKVDYQQAWNVLRDMAQDKDYRAAVLDHIT